VIVPSGDRIISAGGCRQGSAMHKPKSSPSYGSLVNIMLRSETRFACEHMIEPRRVDAVRMRGVSP
jgi:hypothetical protein